MFFCFNDVETVMVVFESPIILFDRTFDEANDLLVKARDYVKYQAPAEVEFLAPTDRLKISCESMRVTARLTQIIAWIMLQKAVQTGELSREETLSEGYRVLGGNTCLDTESETDTEVPPRLRELLVDSRKMYFRILRLDQLTRKTPMSQDDIKKLTDR